jgi:membrane protein YqaA with SNARE-associated domain
MNEWLQLLLNWLSLPEVGLPTLFVVAFVSATLLPMGSEAALFGLVTLKPELFWPAIAVATVGNTAGGALSWAMGLGLHTAVDVSRHQRNSDDHTPRRYQNPAGQWALDWLARLGPKACLLSWLPIVGDPLCAVAGWLRLPFWPCVFYMALGKLLRYITLTYALVWGWALWL